MQKLDAKPTGMNEPSNSSNRTWTGKFADAFRGVRLAVQESSFKVHMLMAAAVIICGIIFRVERIEWCILLVCIGMVMAAEVFNSAIESLSKAVDRNHNPDIGRALDQASGAVLICSLAAAAAGATIFIYRLVVLLGR